MMQQSTQPSAQKSWNGRETNAKETNSSSNFSLPLQSPEYTLPGVLHFLQQEWRRFERERNEWEIEKAEYKARIALLEGERRGFANLKLDLMKRVKMLEYALRQERKKFMMNPKARSLQQSEELAQTVDSPNPPSSPNLSSLKEGNEASLKSDVQDRINSTYTTTYIDDKAKARSRELLKSCLQEINYLTSSTSKLPYTAAFSSTIPNLYTKNVSNLNVASQDAQSELDSSSQARDLRDDNKTSTRRQQQRRTEDNISNLIQQQGTTALQDDKSMSFDTSSEDSQSRKVSDTPSTISDIEVPDNVDEVAMINNVINIANERKQRDKSNHSSAASKGLTEEEQLAKDVQEKYNLSEDKVRKLLKNAERLIHQENRTPASSAESLLGQVAHLQLPSDPPTESIESEAEMKPKMWRAKHNLRGHLDCVRSVSLHGTDLLIASASDDGTVKLWDLKHSLSKDTAGQKKHPHEDIDPVITYRGHSLGVTKVEISAEQGRLYSSSIDSTIRVWKLPPADRAPYASVDSSLNVTTYIGHTDAIWDFKLFPGSTADSAPLVSASADGTVKIWDTGTSGNLLKSSWTFNGAVEEYSSEHRNLPVPTSLDFCHTNLRQLAVAYRNTEIKVFDIETGQIVLTLPAEPTSDNSCLTQINKIVSHPTLPLLITGHENKLIKFYDTNSGDCVFTMPAHLDGVTTLDIDPSGFTLVSGGHDGSIRLWDISSTSRSCVQEFTAHRRKADEGVLSVQFHKGLPWLVSGGADGIIKAYHHSI